MSELNDSQDLFILTSYWEPDFVNLKIDMGWEANMIQREFLQDSQMARKWAAMSTHPFLHTTDHSITHLWSRTGSITNNHT